jgi:diguanylate cyclase
MVDAAVGSASNYSESLAGVSRHIPNADREGLRGIVESLVQTAKEMESVNHALEERLSASKREINQLQENLEAARNESLTDPLTSLANRKYFDQALPAAMTDAIAENESLALLMTDIDHFKAFNDTYGHLTGDQVLRLVALSVKQNVKGQDIAARYGGEEFAVILPNTVLRSAVTVAEHIRRAVMSKELMKRSTGEHLGRITISIGVATLHKDDSAQSLIGRADACLYAAKRAGRNRVICETDPEVTAAPAAAVA